MRPLRILLARLRALVGRHALDRDLQDQIAGHLEEAVEEYERNGLSREQAIRAAHRSFGGVLQAEDAHRDLRSFRWLEDARSDVRYALRTLRRSPGFACVAVATMALAIGAATALFSVIDAALLRPLPYEKPEEIVFIAVGDSFERRVVPSAADIESWRDTDAIFTRVGMGRVPADFRPSIVDAGTPERLTVGSASEDFLEVFGVHPVIGRAFTIEDRRPGSPLVVLLGHHYWQTRFHSAPDVLGKSIRVDGAQATIVGVIPSGFYPDTMLWRPHVVTAAMHARRGSGTPVYGRLRPGLEVEAAARELSARLSTAESNADVRAWITSLYDGTTRGYGRTVAVLSGAVIMIVLIACVNIAGLLLARGATRQPELAIRTSIGASRGRLTRQLLTESAVLASVGGVAGILLTWAMLDVLIGLIPLNLPDNVTAAINLQVLAFAFGLSMLTAFGFGLAPALRYSNGGVGVSAAAARLRHGSVLTRRSGQVLIALEVTLALVLATGAALMIRSFSKIWAVDVGFDPDAIVTMEVVPVDVNTVAPRPYYIALLERVRQIPGVAAAGGVDRPPLDGSGSYGGATANGDPISVARRSVMPGYFEAVGLPLIQGRFPMDADYAASSPFAVLSESAARAIFPNQSAVGQAFTLSNSSWTVIGVVSDAVTVTPIPDGRERRPDVYLAYRPNPQSSFGAGLNVVVRPAGRVPRLAEQLTEAAKTVGPSVFVGPVRSGRDWFGDQVTTERQRMIMLSLLGGLGLTLTLVGIFATTSYTVARRTREMGVRMALGARSGQMIATVVRDAAWPLAIGLVVGLAAAMAATRVIASFLFETTPTDPATFATTVIALALTGLVAAWIPARRAAEVDPITVLRAE